MRVRDAMTPGVYRSTADRSLMDAVHMMWTHDIGCIPVVDDDDQPIGLLTDRDVCMTAFARDLPLRELKVGEAMSRGIFTCKLEDSLEHAETTMRDWQVSRLPVVDTLGKLRGIISLTDIARVRAAAWTQRGYERLTVDVLNTLVAISGRRHRAEREIGR